jgi:protein-L-isoaspartate(D-aspartate) O-methyltransferase
MVDLPELRRSYARRIAAIGGVTSQDIIDAFATIPREQFLGPGPWQVRTSTGYVTTETSDPAVLYQDILIGLVPERGINNGQPSLHARCLSEAAPRPGERAVHIGAGTGYYTAILAHLLGPSGMVIAYEVEPMLAANAAKNLRLFPMVRVEMASALDRPLMSADIIYVSAGISRFPLHWLDALTPGGRMVLPLTPTGGLGHMWKLTKVESDRYSARVFSSAVFIPCAGGQDPQDSDALAAAIRDRPADEVRSLRRDVPHDDSAWLVGDGWWLSTAAP